MRASTTLFFLLIALAVVTVELRGHRQSRAGKHHKKHNHILKSKYKTKIEKHREEHIEGSRKHHDSRIYKKYAMLAAPSLPLEEASPFQSQSPQQVSQQMMVPVDMNQDTSEMVSSYSSTPEQPAVSTDASAANQQTDLGVPQQQFVSNPAGQTMQFQTAQDDPNQAAPQVLGAAPTFTTTGPADADPGDTQSFAPTQGKQDDMKNVDIYSGPLPGSKPKMPGVGPQEQVKIVNLGEDEKLATAPPQVAPCGGCPPGATCVNGQCRIQEQDARAQALGGKGSASNPGTVNDIHSLESQELKTLLKEASAADPATSPEAAASAPIGNAAPLATAQPPTAASLPADLLEDPLTASANTEAHGAADHMQEMQSEGTDTTAPSPKPAKQYHQQEMQSIGTEATAQSPKLAKQFQNPVEPRFSHKQINELRDFARMYKMYQFIRKMEQRINDPECAPICHKICKKFCPAKCCRKHGNVTLPKNLMKTVSGLSINKDKKPVHKAPPKVDATLDDEYDDDDEEDEMNENAGKKHLYVRIVKNNELDKPRSNIHRKLSSSEI